MPIATTVLRAGVVGAAVVGMTCELNSQKSSVTTSLMRPIRPAALPVKLGSMPTSNGTAGEVGPPPTAPNSGNVASATAG